MDYSAADAVVGTARCGQARGRPSMKCRGQKAADGRSRRLGLLQHQHVSGTGDDGQRRVREGRRESLGFGARNELVVVASQDQRATLISDSISSEFRRTAMPLSDPMIPAESPE